MNIKDILISAIPVWGQIDAVRYERGGKALWVEEIRRRKSGPFDVSQKLHFARASVIHFQQGVKQVENEILIGSLFQAVVSVGLAAVLKWSVLGIGGMVLGVGFFAVACYWRWQTSRYIGSEQSEWHRLCQQKIRDGYTKWKGSSIEEDSRLGLVALDRKGAQSEYNEIFPDLPSLSLIPEIPELTALYQLQTDWERQMNFYFLRENDSRIPLKQHEAGEKAFTAFQAAMDKYLALTF